MERYCRKYKDSKVWNVIVENTKTAKYGTETVSFSASPGLWSLKL